MLINVLPEMTSVDFRNEIAVVYTDEYVLLVNVLSVMMIFTLMFTYQKAVRVIYVDNASDSELFCTMLSIYMITIKLLIRWEVVQNNNGSTTSF